jgi:hypothetical protein
MKNRSNKRGGIKKEATNPKIEVSNKLKHSLPK